MNEHEEFVRFQAENHPLEGTSRFESEEAYCLYLMHLKAYEEIAALARGKTVLDLGCNNGWGTRVIGGVAQRVIGVDVSEISVAEAQRSVADDNIKFQTIDGKTLPFLDGEFGLVASCQVIEHVADYGVYLGEIKRVLSADGPAVFTTPNACIRLDPGMKPWFPFHVREFSADDLSSLLRQWFPRVRVVGLFAKPHLYKIEFDRVQRSRELARRRAEGLLPPYIELRTKVIDTIKSLLPNRIVRDIQSFARKFSSNLTETESRTLKSNMDTGVLRDYSTADFFYSEEKIDEALDLLAVCHRNPGD